MRIATDLDLSGALIPGAYTANDISNTTLPISSLVWNTDTKQYKYHDGNRWLPFHVYSFRKLTTDDGIDNIINRNTASYTNVNFNGDDSGKYRGFITIVGTDAIKTLYDGHVKISYTMPHISTGARAGLESRITQTRGTNVNAFAYDYSYMRNASGHNKDCCRGTDIVECQDGDLFRLNIKRNGTVDSAINFINIVTFMAEKA